MKRTLVKTKVGSKFKFILFLTGYYPGTSLCQWLVELLNSTQNHAQSLPIFTWILCKDIETPQVHSICLRILQFFPIRTKYGISLLYKKEKNGHFCCAENTPLTCDSHFDYRINQTKKFTWSDSWILTQNPCYKEFAIIT